MLTKAELIDKLRELNVSEVFYRNYRLAKASPISFGEYLERLDMEQVREHKLLVPELPETIPPEYREEWYFSPDRREGIHIFKHDCYCPAIEHSHDFFEFFYVLEGHCVHQVGGKHSMLHAGDCCLIQPKVRHSIDVSDESIVIDVLIRRSTFRQNFFSILQGDNLLSTFFMSTLYRGAGMDYLIFHTTGDHGFREMILDLCREYFVQEDYFRELVNGILMQVFVRLLRRHTETCELPDKRSATTDKAMEFIRYIQLNSADLTLDQLAQHFHYTPEYASRLIRQTTGQTYSQMVTQMRMENAKILLRDTTMTIAEVGASVGYDSPEHFIRTVSKTQGQTPSNYRKEA